MGKDEDYKIDDLLLDSKKALDDLGEIDELVNGGMIRMDENASESAVNKFIENDDSGQEYKSDGAVEIRVSEDKMYVTADFFPPSEGGNPLQYEEVSVKLANRGVVSGILTDKIQETVYKCNTSTEEIKGVLLAKGTFPEDEIPEHYVIEDHLNRRDQRPGEKQNIDYKKISPFVLVRKDALIGKLVQGKEGRDGFNVLGDTLEHRVKKIMMLKPGKNIREENGRLYSSCDGRFEQQNSEFYVNEVLQISKDVDYSTGNINFPGDVMIGGNILDGFKLVSGGSIFTMKTLDASEVVCEGDLNVKQGIIGRKNATVKVGGIIRAKFIENCYIEAGDNIYLEAGAVNSAIYTSGRIELTNKGVIVGGTCYAQNGVAAVQIGSQMGPRTEIYCGVDYKIANKLEWIRDNSMKLATKLNKIDAEIKKNKITEGELLEVRGKLKESITKLNTLAASLVYKLDRNDTAEVIVSGNIYPGVYIEICHISYVVNRVMSASRFRLDKGRGTITVSAI